MSEIFSLAFMQRAMIAGILLGAVSGFLGVFVVQRKISFLGSGLSHAAFGGIAMGIFLGVEPMFLAIPFTLLIAVLMVFLKKKADISADTSIGILFSVAMAIGIIFLALNENYSADAYSYLFGSILNVSAIDLAVVAALSLIIAVIGKIYWGRWAYSTFDMELARTSKLPVETDEYILTLLISLLIVVSIKVVGMLLLGAYLVIPAATARIVSRTFFQMSVLSIVIGAVSSIGGLILSYFVDLPSGAVIILLQAILLIVLLIAKRI